MARRLPFAVLMTLAEAAQCQQAATRCGQGFSGWARRLLLDASGQPPSDEPAAPRVKAWVQDPMGRWVKNPDVPE